MRQRVAEFKTPSRPLNGLSPLETSQRFFMMDFLLAQCGKVNVAGGGLRVDCECMI